MNKLACAAVAAISVLAAGGAPAADLPSRPAPAPYRAPPVVPPPVFSWTGFYVGGNVGYGWASRTADVTFLNVTTRLDSENLKGAVAGGQVGFNWQTGPLVLGVEADTQWSGQKASFGLAGVAATDRINTFATVRGRVGFAADRVLFYGTGGWARATWRTDLTVPGAGSANYSISRNGWAAGAGVEGAFAWNWTAKLEYLYLDSGSIVDNTTLPGVTFSNRVRDNVVRVGLNYLLNGGPVVARN
jgi:outer membrane immunogenic protein